jgi:gliding motility-associated-like protein
VSHYLRIDNLHIRFGKPLVAAWLVVLLGWFDSMLAQSQERNTRLAIHMPATQDVCPKTYVIVAPDSITGGVQPYRFTWYTASGISGTDSSIAIVVADTTTILLQVMGADGVIERDSIRLDPYKAIDSGFEVDTWEGCTPMEVRFSSNYLAFQNISQMRWEYGTGAFDQQLASAVYVYETPGLYFPTLSITDNHGCIWTDTLLNGVRAYPAPQADFHVSEDKLYLPDTRLEVQNRSEGATQYVWHFTGGAPIEGYEPIFHFPANREGDYELELYAKNAFGCAHKTSKTIEVVQGIELFIPNAFTPDGDGINDFWLPQGLGVDAYNVSLEIYDVWGTVVYTSTDFQAAWSGRSEPLGLYVPPGQYNYRIIARDTERGIGHLFEGHIMVLR